MNKKIPSVLAIGIILILSIVIGGVIFLDSKTIKQDNIQLVNINPSKKDKSEDCFFENAIISGNGCFFGREREIIWKTESGVCQIILRVFEQISILTLQTACIRIRTQKKA